MPERLLVLLVAASLAGCGSQGAATAGGDAEKDVNGSKAAAERLASADQQSPVVKRALIRRYANALDRLEPHCREPRQRLADFAVYSTWQLERQSGVATKPLEMLDRVEALVRGAVTPTRCRAAFLVTVSSWHA